MRDYMKLQHYAGRTACDYCIGCGLCEEKVNGPLRVADTLRYMMYHDCYHDKRNEARQLYAKLSEAERAFGHLDLSAAERACPQGIPISTIMTFDTLVKRLPPGWYLNGPFIPSAMVKVPECLDCGECESRCPYDLPIRDMLKQNYDLYEKIKAEAA